MEAPPTVVGLRIIFVLIIILYPELARARIGLVY